MTYVEILLPGSSEPSGTVRSGSIFCNATQDNLATQTVGIHNPGALRLISIIDIVCTVQLPGRVNICCKRTGLQLLRAQEKNEAMRESNPRVVSAVEVQCIEIVAVTQPAC